MSYILQTKNLEKNINGRCILSGLDIHIKKGEIYGLLGPNGAGKTSFMKMIMNYWKPTGGEIQIFGEKLTPKSYKYLSRIGSIIEFPVFYEHLSGEKNLQIHCKYMKYKNQSSIEKVLDLLELSKDAKRPVKQYSLGMKQRLAIARAIVTEPEILILDEPTNGLDPIGMKHIRDLFHMLKEELGVTILISTHILSEIENMADTVGIIAQGKIKKEISIKELTQLESAYIEVKVEDPKSAIDFLNKMSNIDNIEITAQNSIYIYGKDITVQEISKALLYSGNEIISIGKKSEHLENYFMHLIEEDRDR